MSTSINQVSGTLRFTLTNDYLFHIVFQENEELLKGLLCSLLNLKEVENLISNIITFIVTNFFCMC
ncbi:MAG: hypothetical protein PUB13_01310 [Lachnospiraceae bacterium]|nr:hypothetical protein [Lachnospiraceae bacterium]